MTDLVPTVAVIGGSGFYEFLENPTEHEVSTPYGDPVAPIAVGDVGGRTVAFLPRHGKGHEFPPHRINYRANIWALRSLGVQRILAPCAVGGLQPETRPGTLVVPDQLVDRTTSRIQTFVDTGAAHAPFADPYCPDLRAALVEAAGEGVLPEGTMVVIEGPRFSTRAESQSYAKAGWTLVNMTGHPEAVLARELGVCYATIALVTDLDAGVSKEESVDQAAVFALFEQHVERLKTLLGEVVAGLPEPADGRAESRPPCGCADWLDDVRLPFDLPRTRGVKVLLTGASGFIGAQIDAQLVARGDEVVKVDALIPEAHPAHAVPGEGVHRLDVRDAARWADLLDDIDVVCHQAAMVGAGVTVADLPLYAGHNDLGSAALMAAMSERGVDAMVFASSMVVYGEGRYSCEEHGAQPAGVRTREALDAGDFENHCSHCRRPLGWELVPEDARLDPRSSYAASKVAQEHYAIAWVRQAPARAIGLRYHNVYGPGMPRDTPYSGVAAIFRSSLEGGRAPRVFEDGGQMRDFVHVADVARANVLAIDAVLARPAESYAAYNVGSGTPIPIRHVAEVLAAASSGPEPVVTGEYRTGDVRHVVASSELAATDLGFRAEITPEQGITEFATAPLR